MVEITKGIVKVCYCRNFLKNLKASNLIVWNANDNLDKFQFFSRWHKNYIVDIADFESLSRIMGIGLYFKAKLKNMDR